jgi:BCD family chlorophyll transporter-like MFS transporter
MNTDRHPARSHLGWVGIFRIGLVQTALGAMVVLTTSTLNRVMVVELALAAVLPGALVALHYAVQITRPKMGHSSDSGRSRTPWIIGGMIVLAIGTVGASLATALMQTHLIAGIAGATAAFVLIGLGVGASGTSLLALLASRVEEHRRPAAATIVWIMMIAGFVVTAGVAGANLDPFSMQRLVIVTAIVSAIAVVIAVVAIFGIERSVAPQRQTATAAISFRDALQETWQDPHAKQFTVFVFVSMLAYSAQDLILEPFAGAVFGFSPGESTQLAGVQHGGVLLGMIIVAVIGTRLARRHPGSLRLWCIGGCIASAMSLAVLGLGGTLGDNFPLKQAVFTLGLSNGIFAVAAIGSMMALASSRDGKRREGIRMGVWGAAQALAFGLGGFLGTALIDLARAFIADTSYAYAIVFFAQAAMFTVSAWLAAQLGQLPNRTQVTMGGQTQSV